MADITSKSVDSLQVELAEKRESLRVYRFSGAGSRSRDVKAGRGIRKDIARILTELNARINAAKPNAVSTKPTTSVTKPNRPVGKRKVAKKAKTA